jgi:hypothetical protein
MIEDIVNASSQGTQAYKWVFERATKTLYFQMASAHSWWMASRRRQGRNALERDAIKAQLKEAVYAVDQRVVHDTWMYGISLEKAQASGLDIPSDISVQEFTIRTGS